MISIPIEFSFSRRLGGHSFFCAAIVLGRNNPRNSKQIGPLFQGTSPMMVSARCDASRRRGWVSSSRDIYRSRSIVVVAAAVITMMAIVVVVAIAVCCWIPMSLQQGRLFRSFLLFGSWVPMLLLLLLLLVVKMHMAARAVVVVVHALLLVWGRQRGIRICRHPYSLLNFFLFYQDRRDILLLSLLENPESSAVYIFQNSNEQLKVHQEEAFAFDLTHSLTHSLTHTDPYSVADLPKLQLQCSMNNKVDWSPNMPVAWSSRTNYLSLLLYGRMDAVVVEVKNSIKCYRCMRNKVPRDL